MPVPTFPPKLVPTGAPAEVLEVLKVLAAVPVDEPPPIGAPRPRSFRGLWWDIVFVLCVGLYAVCVYDGV
jgi:hypothetical protein